MQTLIYRARYYWRKLCHFFRVCPKCYSPVSVTRHGQCVCHSCKQR
jgi:hypothetical protein